MHKKQKHKKQKLIIRSWLAAIVVLAGGLSLAASSATLTAHKLVGLRTGAVSLAAPKVLSTAAAAQTPVPTPAMAVATRRRVTRLAYTPKPLPIVAAAPGSSVSQLVAVAPSPTPSAEATPSPVPGRGSGPAATPIYQSSNWAGYMSPAGGFTGVRGSWTVPSAGGNGRSASADAAWIGIGGVTSADLIQTGTDDFVSPAGVASYEAFYEMLPAPSAPVPAMVVGAGDVMSADITNAGGSLWKITITDETRNETFSITVTYTSSESSAEWIEEDPSYAAGHLVPLDSFGTVSFTGSTATQNAAVESLGEAGGQAIELVDSRGRAVATASVVGPDGASFSVTHN